MNLIEIVILIFVVQISSFLMFNMAINNKNKKKTINPIEVIKEKKEEKQKQEEYDLERRQRKVMMENIDAYDGTSLGQKDIPTE